MPEEAETSVQLGGDIARADTVKLNFGGEVYQLTQREVGWIVRALSATTGDEFDRWFLKVSSWGLSRDQLVSASFNTPGRDPGDDVYTSPTGSVMTRHICSHWINFHDASQMGWNAARNAAPSRS